MQPCQYRAGSAARLQTAQPWHPATIHEIGTQIVVMQTDAGQRAVARVLAAIE